jgi:hypothetical protein
MLHTASDNANFAPMVAAAPAATPTTQPAPVTLVLAEPTTQPVKLAPQTQPAAQTVMVAAANSTPSTQPVASATTQPTIPAVQPADLAILADSVDSPATQPSVAPATQPSTQPDDDMDSSQDDSVAPDDDGQ